MRQVPTIYGIVGSGRLAQHFCHYLQLLQIPFYQWSRKNNIPPSNVLASCTHLLILIRDDAIEDFIFAHPELKNKTIVHCSGQLTTSAAYGAHPLMTFTSKLYDLNLYLKIPFVIEECDFHFNDLLPGLPNPHYVIPREQKALYHSLCVLSGNFSCLLWNKVFKEFEQTLKLPKDILYLYMEKIMTNLKTQSENALTGPLIRKDEKTIQANLQALRHDPFQKIYQAFVDVYKKENTL